MNFRMKSLLQGIEPGSVAAKANTQPLCHQDCLLSKDCNTVISNFLEAAGDDVQLLDLLLLAEGSTLVPDDIRDEVSWSRQKINKIEILAAA